MAYGDTHTARLKKLIQNPRQEVTKILPFIKNKITPSYRRLLESLRVYSLSKPFSAHDRFLPHINFKKGFFVQCGGMDGYGNDPTYYLEKALGWKGIIVEPLPTHALCQKNRHASTVFNSAAGSFEDRNKILPFVDLFGMSFIKGSIGDEKDWIEKAEKSQGIVVKTIEVSMRPVQDLIDEYFKHHAKRDIDLFVADVEGYELNVLKGLDFEKNPPKQLLLEISKNDRLTAIEAYLAQKKYRLIEKFENDYLFKHA